jgi:DNA-binding NarL/FixJ family response regulator
MGIAVLVSAGRTNQQIARALELSNKTVETYLSRIFRKLDICSRSQIATLIGRSQADSADTGGPSSSAIGQAT